MTTLAGERIRFTDLSPESGDTREEFLRGLRGGAPRRIAPKFFYDGRGSRLFDRICELDEYYPTRTEISILRENAGALAAACGPRCLLVELGSGSSLKTRLLLEALEDPAGYVPIDVSRPHLLAACERLAAEYPQLEILPVCADYAQPIALPRPLRRPRRTVLFFPGSTIGNFEPAGAESFLRHVAGWCRVGDRMIVGVDLAKEPRMLEAAYNDREGVTAEFNLNVLRRANAEFGANFDLRRFEHEAIYDAAEGRIEMRLVSTADQEVRLGSERLHFRRGERILTEYSYKYRPEAFATLAGRAGWSVLSEWTDPRGWFGVFALEFRG